VQDGSSNRLPGPREGRRESRGSKERYQEIRYKLGRVKGQDSVHTSAGWGRKRRNAAGKSFILFTKTEKEKADD